MNVEEAIRTKRAVRNFTDQPLPDDAIRAILDAGRRAQSSKNTQPWRFIAIRDRDTLLQLSACGTYAGHLAGATLGVALVSPIPTGFDMGQAAANMQLAAWELGIGSCLATIYEPEKARALLGIPDDQFFNYALSFGYPAPNPNKPATPKRGGRQQLDEVVSWEHW
jgi:nitroreductase